ncbi:MAG: hypothetical protein LKI18_04725 [Prevotella sp.]|jgi:hypothetical protein|nr:hypothetical protein [Prevotella sp.]
MRKLTMILMVFVVGTIPFLFTSCDNSDDGVCYYNPWDAGFNWNNPWWYHYNNGDYDWNNYYDNGREDQGDYILAEAQVLNGEWSGVMQYVSAKSKTTTKFNCDMTFTQYDQNSINGTGIEVDASGDESQTLHFRWYIDERNGDIYIKYDSGTTFVMDAQSSQRGLSLREGDYFDGYMIGSNTNDMAYIQLDRVTANNAIAADVSRAAASQHRFFGSTNLIKPKMNAPSKLIKR